jgi:PAS domain S-box-containing protein
MVIVSGVWNMATKKKLKKELLLQRAEKLLSKNSQIVSKIEDKDVKKLIHQLQVHQVELEMQNQELRKAQAEIEESRTKYSDLYDFSPVGYFTFSQAGEIVEANLPGAGLLDVERTDLLHRPFSAFVDPNFQSLFRDHRLNVLRRGGKERCELKLIKKDGKSFYASLESIPVPRGRNQRIRSAVSDITHFKEMEKELKQLNTQLEELVRQRTAELESANQQLKQEVAERKRMEEKLCKSRDELEISVQGRTAELAKTNEELKAEIDIRKRAEEALQKMTHELTERVKEINCLYSVCYSIEKKYGGIEEKLKNIVYQIPSGWQFPEIACARITFEDKEYRTENFKETPWRQASQIIVDGKEVGAVEVYYLEERPKADEESFLKEERSLIRTIAIELGEMIGHMQADEAVKAERQRFNDVLEMLPAYVVLLTPDHHVAFDNRFFRQRFGESHGRRCFEYLFGRSKPCEICETYTVLKTNAPHHWEWMGPDGRIYDIYDFPFTDTDGFPLIMEMGIDITERKRAEEALKAAQQYNRSLIEASLDPLVTISADGKVMDLNRATELVTGISREELTASNFSDYFTDPAKAKEGYQKVFTEGLVKDYPLAIRHTSGKVTDVLYNATVYRNEAGEVQGIFAAARDITVRKGLQRRIEATNALLNLFVTKSTRKEYLDSVIELIQPWSGCRCVGIRILNEKDYIPYESYVGFNQEFWESENLLSVKYDQCACIRVVTGNPDPQDRPVMTPAGSFRCENIFEFVGTLSKEEKSRFRSVCVKNGFKSVAVIPIRYRDKVLGAIHIADEREGTVPTSNVQFMESMTPLIGEAVNRFNLEEELKDSENRLRHLSSQLLAVQENERRRISREIHDSLGQSLSAIKFKVEGITQDARRSRSKKMAESLETVLPIIQASIEESRRIQMDLRPSTLDDLGILATLEWFCREYQKIYDHIRIEKKVSVLEDEVCTPLKTAIYRVMQEALNNIAKHSKAEFVDLSLKKEENKIQLAIEDNGIGFDIEKVKKGIGLDSMRERAELSGGTFEIESVIGGGTTIRASWPI